MKIKIKLFIIFVILSSCKKEINFDLQGHRGYRGLYPENSIQGFIKSLEIGVNTLELDVIISGDNKVVVSHEPWMSYHICLDSIGNKISDDKKKYNLYEMDYNDIRKFDCGIIGNEQFPEQNKISTFKPHLSSVLAIISAQIAAIVIGRPLIDPELSISKVTIVSLNFISFSCLYDSGNKG